MPWGVAAAAVAAGGAYMSAEKANKKTKRPAWIEEGERFAVDRSREIADRPYQAFGGQRVAGMSGNERQASELARFGSDESKSYLDRAGRTISDLQRFDEADLNPYMNPYTDAVLQPQLREANRAYESERTRLLNSKAGAWGGDRAAFAESELGRRHGELVTDVTARAHSEAFDRATQLWSQDQDRQLRSADALRSVGNDVSRLNTQQIQDLMATGGVERMLQQAEIDFDYQQFIENRDWSVNNLQPLLQALGTAQAGDAQRRPEVDPWGQALGAAATIAGMYFAGTGGKQDKPPAQKEG